MCSPKCRFLKSETMDNVQNISHFVRILWCSNCFKLLIVMSVMSRPHTTIIWLKHKIKPVSREAYVITSIFFSLWRCGPTQAMASSFLGFLDHIQWRITVGRTPLDEWSARRSANTKHSQKTDIHAPDGIQTHNLSSGAAADLRPRPSRPWDPLIK